MATVGGHKSSAQSAWGMTGRLGGGTIKVRSSSGEDASLSRRRRGFDSRTDRARRTSVVK